MAKTPQHTTTVQLKNLCSNEVSYVFHKDGKAEGPVRKIAGKTTERIQVPLGYMVGWPDSRGGAMTDVDGGVVWFDEDCQTMGASDDPNFDPSKFKPPM